MYKEKLSPLTDNTFRGAAVGLGLAFAPRVSQTDDAPRYQVWENVLEGVYAFTASNRTRTPAVCFVYVVPKTSHQRNVGLRAI